MDTRLGGCVKFRTINWNTINCTLYYLTISNISKAYIYNFLNPFRYMLVKLNYSITVLDSWLFYCKMFAHH